MAKICETLTVAKFHSFLTMTVVLCSRYNHGGSWACEAQTIFRFYEDI